MGIGSSRCALGAGDFVMDLGSRCSTLREALTLCFRFMEMATDALRFQLHEDGNRAVVEVVEQPSPRDPHHLLADWNMIVWHKLSQWLTGMEIWLDRTEFVHELDAPYSSYAEMFGTNCVFNSPVSRLVFKRSYLEHRVIRTPTEAEWLIAKAPGYFSRPVGLAKPWKRQISELFRDDIKKGRRLSTIEDLAERFGVSSQTLRRRLREEGISYRALKAETRREVVLDVLADPKATIGEASIAAGFAETNALNRALKSTKGFSSRELREQVMRWSGKRAPPPGGVSDSGGMGDRFRS
jgi:AraC-like DNA-binding protein